jgi:hypothetical protein
MDSMECPHQRAWAYARGTGNVCDMKGLAFAGTGQLQDPIDDFSIMCRLTWHGQTPEFRVQITMVRS